MESYNISTNKKQICTFNNNPLNWWFSSVSSGLYFSKVSIFLVYWLSLPFHVAKNLYCLSSLIFPKLAHNSPLWLLTRISCLEKLFPSSDSRMAFLILWKLHFLKPDPFLEATFTVLYKKFKKNHLNHSQSLNHLPPCTQPSAYPNMPFQALTLCSFILLRSVLSPTEFFPPTFINSKSDAS
jgi:hypothetical protein